MSGSHAEREPMFAAEGSGNYPRCTVTGCVYRAVVDGHCSAHAVGAGGRKPPSPRQMIVAADVLHRFIGSTDLTAAERDRIVSVADSLSRTGRAALGRPS